MGVYSLKEKGLLKDLQKITDKYEALLRDTVNAIIAALAAKDIVTGGHAVRVSHYAVMIGRALNFSQKELMRLELGALLHDVGKIGIPDNILMKPGPLTASEFEAMKKHPVMSADILSKIKPLKEILPIVRHHQEKFDGSGYPDGLKGEAIPFYARITYVADAFDAMTADRPYRKAFTEKVAINELEKNAGIQFDPKIVKVFVKAYQKYKGEASLSEFFPIRKRKKAVGE